MVEYDPQEKELVKTLDLKLIPFLAVLYFILLMDRSNQVHTGLSNLQTEETLKKFLGIDSDKSSMVWSLVAFSLGSLLATLPITIGFRKIGPSLSFAVMLGGWGLTMIVTAVVKDYGWFIFSRFILGGFQAGFVPCIVVYLFSFYTKEESATRLAYVMSISTVSQSFSELILDYAAQLKNADGLSGWQRFYIIEGILGLVMAIITGIFLPSFPETCKFLNPADRVLAVARGRDGYDKEDSSLITKATHIETRAPTFRFKYVQFLDSVQDVRIWFLGISYLFVTASLDLLIVATPEVSAEAFGITRTCVNNCTTTIGEEQLDLSKGIPFSLEMASITPYVLGMIVSYYVSAHSDNTDSRANSSSLSLMAAVIGFLFLAIFDSPSQPARYFLGILPSVVGLIAATPSILAYAMEHASGDTQRGTTASISVGLGQSLGLLVTALLQLTHSNPSVSSPTVYGLTALGLSISIGCLYRVQRMNEHEAQSGWGKAPGLRRLLNDVDEAKAWDIELNNVEDFIKSHPIGVTHFGWSDEDEV